MAQTAYLGYGARRTESKEQTSLAGKQDEILDNAREFYEALAAAFPEVDDVFTGRTEPSEFRGNGRRTSLLASSTTIKALASASVWHDLKYGFRWEAVGGQTVGKVTSLIPLTATGSSRPSPTCRPWTPAATRS